MIYTRTAVLDDQAMRGRAFVDALVRHGGDAWLVERRPVFSDPNDVIPKLHELATPDDVEWFLRQTTPTGSWLERQEEMCDEGARRDRGASL